MQYRLAFSQVFLKHRRLFLFLPLLAAPGLALLFYGLGGGKGGADPKAQGAGHFNTSLPAPIPGKKDDGKDKMSFYNSADMDSARRKALARQEQYQQALALINAVPGRPESSRVTADSPIDQGPDPEVLLKKLDQLKQGSHRPVMVPSYPANREAITYSYGSRPVHEDISRLEKLLPQLQKTDASQDGDPQLDRVNSLLEKLINIQHPGRTGSERDSNLAAREHEPYTLTINTDSRESAGWPFVYIGDALPDTLTGNMIPAVAQEDQTITPGAVLAFRLTQDTHINGIDIPKGVMVYGVARLTGERMSISITSLRNKASVYPINLEVYDLDGLAGIHIPGSETRSIAKESTGQGISSLDMGALSPSLPAQAATAGVQAARTIFSRKVKQVKVFIRAGYQVLLKNAQYSR